MRKIVFFAALLLCVASCKTLPDKGRILPGDRLPSFSVTMNDGSILSTSTLSKDTALIVFFSTTCPDCQKELPTVQSFYERHKEKMTIAAISREETAQSIEKWWKAHGISLPFSAQKDRKVYELFSQSGIPFTVLAIDGTVVHTWDDRIFFDEEEYKKILQ